MNKLFLLLFVLLANNIYVNADSTNNTGNGMANVIYESKSSNILFYIDDSLYSLQSRDTLAIQAGYHSLKASTVESDLWSAVDWRWDGNLKADSTYYFEIMTKRFVVLNSVPYGADVMIEGIYVGTTPYILESTNRAVELIKSNYMPVRIEPIDLNNKSFISINLLLETLVFEIEEANNLANIGYDRDKLITRSTYVITAISGVAAVYFKFEADKAFNKLSDAVDPADQRFLSDRVEKYDNLAAISFGTFQTGFLYSIYRVIRHR